MPLRINLLGGNEMTFGQRLRKYRKERKLSQNALAELSGISPRTIFGYEVGTTYPRTENMLNRLADALGVTREALVGETMKPDRGFSYMPELPYEAQAQMLTHQVISLLNEDGLSDVDKDMMVKAIMDAYCESRRRSQSENDVSG